MNPSAAEVKVELDKASAEVDNVSGADSKVDKAQVAAAGDTARADELIGDLVDYLDFATRKLDGPSQRRIMRRYGIKFAYRPGENTRPRSDADTKVYSVMLGMALVAHRYQRPELAGSRAHVLTIKTVQ